MVMHNVVLLENFATQLAKPAIFLLYLLTDRSNEWRSTHRYFKMAVLQLFPETWFKLLVLQPLFKDVPFLISLVV